MLHVRCGSDILDDLRAAGVPGEFLVWADPLSQGPTRAANVLPGHHPDTFFFPRQR